jgi:hypothetical protein
MTEPQEAGISTGMGTGKSDARRFARRGAAPRIVLIDECAEIQRLLDAGELPGVSSPVTAALRDLAWQGREDMGIRLLAGWSPSGETAPDDEPNP